MERFCRFTWSFSTEVFAMLCCLIVDLPSEIKYHWEQSKITEEED